MESLADDSPDELEEGQVSGVDRRRLVGLVGESIGCLRLEQGVSGVEHLASEDGEPLPGKKYVSAATSE